MINNRKQCLTILLAVIVSASNMVFANDLGNKHLAGPPEEFDLMQSPLPEKAAISSKIALIPVSLSKTKSNEWTWNGTLPIDSPDFSFIVFSNEAKNWQIDLTNPKTKQSKSAGKLAYEQVPSTFSMGNSSFLGSKYTFEDLDAGLWNINIKTSAKPEQFDGYILLANSSPFLLKSYKANFEQVVGDKLKFVAQSTFQSESDVAKANESWKNHNPIDSTYMLVTYPDDSQSKFSMFDDGLHGDKLANDGVFGGDFSPDVSGGYIVQIIASGINPDGSPFYRTSEHYVPVIEQTLSLDAPQLETKVIGENRLNIGINVVVNQAKSSIQNRYRIFAEVWGADRNGKMVPVSWISTITNVQNNQLNIELDTRWIAMSETIGSFELRKLRIEDSDHFIPLVSNKTLQLNINNFPKSASKTMDADFLINQEMLMGVRPVIEAPLNKSSNRQLLLVHGYCSENVWGFSMRVDNGHSQLLAEAEEILRLYGRYMNVFEKIRILAFITGLQNYLNSDADFDNAVIFKDLKANRSHDAFARRIRDFGAQYDSFGIVAHSQGGAAALHLYTYYWSGLDYSPASSSKRMIQSVGTPYLGTPLAGSLASLGNVFGVGCGTNSNLTPLGAFTWSVRIPTWARNKVNYYTTSFKDRRWRYDYCSRATDLFLRDPDDGVTERYRGQLSGATNRGHKTGWCHTESMRDPGQATDISRNIEMNQNAQR